MDLKMYKQVNDTIIFIDVLRLLFNYKVTHILGTLSNISVWSNTSLVQKKCSEIIVLDER